ncbi:hypothetical protein GCM10011409_43020 [Lentibacillus populi]|uniref:Uncharacterized protein n=1 Tax=Lentibacillus populi TaxID=1827502 RepID=A0A9W5X801_9BACI|nr:hypothetical protein GCM10011409_43020 [Lentibacillus populi]
MKKRRKILAKRLEDDLLSGKWDKKYGKHRTLPGFIGAEIRKSPEKSHAIDIHEGDNLFVVLCSRFHFHVNVS